MRKFLRAISIAIVILWAALAARAQGGNIGSTSSPVANNMGRPIPGANIAICQPLATTAASVTSNVAVLTMASNPVTAGYAAGTQILVAGFTGADTYFNGGSIVNGQITGGFTILSVTPTTITYSLTHANASASTNGTALQEGNSTTSCAGLAAVFSDPGLTQPITQPIQSDALGNWNAFAVPGLYYVQFYGANVSSTIRPFTIGCVPGNTTNCGGFTNASNIWSALQKFTGGLTGGNLNSFLYVDGTQYATPASALAAVPASGTTVLVPPGSFSSASTLTVPANTVLQGAGMGATTIVYSGTGTGIAMGGSHITLKDLTLQCTNASQTGSGIAGNGSSSTDIHLERVHVTGCLNFVNAGGATGTGQGTWYINNSLFENGLANGDGVYTGLAGQILADHIVIRNLPNGNCIDINTPNNIFSHVILMNCNTSGTVSANGNDIDIQSISGSQASGNIIDHFVILEQTSDQPSQAVRISPVSSSNASGNIVCGGIITLNGKIAPGINFDGASGTTADANVVCNDTVTGALDAIYLFTNSGQLTNTLVTGNTAHDNAYGLVILTGATGTVYGGNHFYNNSTANIQDNGTSDPNYMPNISLVGNSSGIVTIVAPATAGTPTLTTPTSTGTLGLVPTNYQKEGSTSGNYTGTNTAAFANLDTTNLCQTVTVPTGWKLVIQASGNITTTTGVATASIGVTDVGTTCAGSGVSPLKQVQAQQSAASAQGTFSLVFILTGDGAAHSISLQAETANASDAWSVQNTNASNSPVLLLQLELSN